MFVCNLNTGRRERLIFLPFLQGSCKLSTYTSRTPHLSRTPNMDQTQALCSLLLALVVLECWWGRSSCLENQWWAGTPRSVILSRQALLGVRRLEHQVGQLWGLSVRKEMELKTKLFIKKLLYLLDHRNHDEKVLTLWLKFYSCIIKSNCNGWEILPTLSNFKIRCYVISGRSHYFEQEITNVHAVYRQPYKIIA